MAVKKDFRRFRRSLLKWLADVRSNLLDGHLWQRMLKNTICTGIMLAIGLIPAVIAVYGRSTYLGAMVTVFGHPGQRFGQMTESLWLIFLGTMFGLGWSFLGLYLSSLAVQDSVSAAYAVRALFYALAIVFHGVLRSSTPRLFLFVFFFLLMSLTVLTGAATEVSWAQASQILYPILTALGVVIISNVLIFPESSSGFLGNSVIETLHDTVRCLEDAGDYFMSDYQVKPSAKQETTPTWNLRTMLVSLTDRKSKLRAKLAGSKRAQAECNFEVVLAVLPPRSLKSISTTSMTRLVQTTIFLINACESKYAMLGDKNVAGTGTKDDKDDSGEDGSSASSADDSTSEDSSNDSIRPPNARRKSKHVRNLELVKPIREIESGDLELLERIMQQVRVPAKSLQDQIHMAVDVITCSLAYCYQVPKLPSGAYPPKGITLEEIDIRVDAFTEAIASFDKDSMQALGKAAAMAYGVNSQVDIMPRMETFLISSFLITLRQAARQISDILRHCRTLVEKRQSRKGGRSLYFPKISWKKWLKTGGEQDISSIPDNARKEARAGHGTREESSRDEDGRLSDSAEQLLKRRRDEEMGQPPEKQQPGPAPGKIPRRKGPKKAEGGTSLWIRGLVADAIEFFADSDDLAFALKMSVAGWLVTWPAFVPSLSAWYTWVRASWASLQLILVFEVSVGTSIQGFILRVFGVIYGCVAGYLAFEIGGGNRIVAVAILVIAMIPATYVHLGTPYVKTGIISIVSMSVVGLASIVQPDSQPWEIFVKRTVCFLVGGTVALIVEMTLFPVRARDRLVESLASGIQQISNMEASVAVGIDSDNVDLKSHALDVSFTHAKEKAEAALAAARTFLPFTLTEPRFKGSFRGQAMIYNEIIYVLFQIVDRMDNMLQMRKVYGSSVLEEFNEKVLPYRRNVAASITLTLFAVHEALTTRLPLPQFLPSSRVAQLRYISRVREVMLEKAESVAGDGVANADPKADSRRSSAALQSHVLESITKQNFLSWNAGSAGMMEIVEYLEELIDLAKLLVGVNAFRTGMLERPKFHEYVSKIQDRKLASATAAETEQEMEKIKSSASANLRKRQGFSGRDRSQSHGAAVLGRRQTLGVRTGADAAVDTDEEGEDTMEDLPMSLQRVRTKRIEGRESERSRKPRAVDAKGKGNLKSAKTWGV